MEITHLQTGRWIVARHEGGTAILRSAPEGLACDVSPDGMLWRKTSLHAEKGSLTPLCAIEGSDEADLLCSDAAGNVIPVRVRDGKAIEGDPIALPAAQSWYEASPSGEDITLLRDASTGSYRAFFRARRTTGRASARRGCIGTAQARDLSGWETEPPALAPNRYAELVPLHVYQEGARSVLLYATQEQGNLQAIRFATAPHLAGPYEQLDPDVLSLDVRTSAQTVLLNDVRLVFFARAAVGTLAPETLSRPGRVDYRPDGRPFVRFYDRLLALLGPAIIQTGASLSSGETLVRILPRHAANFRLGARLRSEGARAVGLLFRTTLAGHDNVTLWLEFDAGAVTLRRGVHGRMLGRVRRALATGNDYRVSVWAEGSFADIYLDDEWILTVPTEVRSVGGFGLAVQGGEARFEDVSVQLMRMA